MTQAYSSRPLFTPKGGSFRVISEGALRGFTLVISPYAYREAEAALEEKYRSHLSELHHLAASIYFVADSAPSEIKKFSP